MIADYRRKLNLLLADYQHARRTCKEEKQALKQAQDHVGHVLQAQQLVQEVAEKVQAQAHAQIAFVVTKCLETIFGESAYQFRINFVKKRGWTEAELVFVKNGQEQDPIHASSGGQLNVAAFGLQVACLILARPAKRRLLLFDEPMRDVNGKEYQDRVKNVLVQLTEEMGLQMIISSDRDWQKIDNVVEME